MFVRLWKRYDYRTVGANHHKKGKEYDVPVLIDPKGCDWTKYRGAYGITPNIKELSDVAGFVINNNDSDIERIGRKVRETFQIEIFCNPV